MQEQSLDSLFTRWKQCRVCRDTPLYGMPLPHEPRPVFQIQSTARLCIASQAPGNRAHQSGIPFSDPSGRRLRSWLGIDEATFYDASRVAIIPMGACFPGYDKNRGDLPPRRECAQLWHPHIFAQLPDLSLVLTIGHYAQKWHMSHEAGAGLTATVANWRRIFEGSQARRFLPLPHPSWRNNGWLKRNPWFEEEFLPVLKEEVRRLLG